MAMTTDNWLQLLGIGAGVGANVYGATQANNAANQQNQQVSQSQNQLYALANQESQRRNQLQSLFLPSLMRDMGIKGDPSMLGSLFQPMGGGQQQQPQQPQQQTQSQPMTMAQQLQPGRTGVDDKGRQYTIGAGGFRYYPKGA